MILNSKTIVANRKYKIISAPSYETGIICDFLVGLIGICRWGDGDGACLTFEDNRSYIIPYCCLVNLSLDRKFRTSPTIHNFEYHRQIYRLCKIPERYGYSIFVYGLIGKLCSIAEYDDEKHLVVIYFDDEKIRFSVSPDCLEDVGLDIL